MKSPLFYKCDVLVLNEWAAARGLSLIAEAVFSRKAEKILGFESEPVILYD